VIEDGFNQLNAILESIKKATQQQNTKPTGRASLASKEQQKKPSQSQLQSPPTEMQKIVEGFWRGDVCLHGGAGWWRHEVCYRKTVKHYSHIRS
jgi:endoplasmic reticulum lectin 1